MRGIRTRRTLLVAAVVMGLLLQAGAYWADLQAASNKVTEITILYTTDLYGKLRDFRCKRPGVKGVTYEPAKRDISNLLYQVNRVRKEVVQQKQLPPPLLFNTGDNLATELAARFLLEFEGLAGVDFVADVFERFGYDLIGLGNHEFSVPSEKLRDFLQQARLKGLKFSAANLDKAPSSHALAKYVNRDGAQKSKYFIFTRGGIKIGVFHLVPNELQNRVSKEAVKGVEFGDPESAAGEIVPKLRDELGADVVVVLSHLESSNPAKTGKAVRSLARAAEGIDLIITNELRSKGRTTAFSNFNIKGKGVHVVGGAKYGAMLGKVILRVKKPSGGKAKLMAFQASSIPLKDDKYDRELRRELIKWESSYCKRWGKPLGKGRIRAKEGITHNQMMDYVLNMLRRMTNTEVAFINVGAIRKKHFPLKGYITKDDLYRALPFESRFVVLPISGSDLNSLIEGYMDVNKPNNPRALHFAGVKDGKINGRAVDDAGTYWVATIGYVASESSGWLTVPKKKHIPVKYSNGSRPELREMLIEHFARNRYRKYLKASKPPKPKPPIDPDTGEPKKGVKLPKPKPFGTNEIPYTGNFVNLADRMAWKFNSEFGLGFTSIFLSPINIGSFYTQKDTLTGGFYQKFQINGNFNLKLRGETRMHLWITTLTGSYDVDQSSQWSQGPPARIGDPLFQENTDQIELKTEYRLRYFETLFPGQQKWYFTSPFLEAVLGTEFTRSSRPDLNDEEFFQKGIATERFRRFETRVKAGLSFQLSSLLTTKLGFAGRKEWALEYKKQNPDTAQVVRTELNVGFSVEYELQSWEFARIGGNAISWESRAEYLFTVFVGGTTKVVDESGNENALGSIHDLVWDNKLSFSITGNLSIALGVKFYLYRGLFPVDPNDEKKGLKAGPLAFRVDPNISLRFNWAKRAQTF